MSVLFSLTDRCTIRAGGRSITHTRGLGCLDGALTSDTIEGDELFVCMCIKLKLIESERKGLLELCGTCGGEWNDKDVNSQGTTQCDSVSVVILVRPYRADAFYDCVMLGNKSLACAIK